MENPFREQLKAHVYYNVREDDVNGRLESTFKMLLQIEPLWDRFKKLNPRDSLLV